MSKLDINKEVETIRSLKDTNEAAEYVRLKGLEVYGNATKYPKTAFAVGAILGLLAGVFLF